MRPSQSLIAALLLGCGGTTRSKLAARRRQAAAIRHREPLARGGRRMNLPTVQAMANEAAATWNPAAKGRRSWCRWTTMTPLPKTMQAWSPRPPHVVYLCPKFAGKRWHCAAMSWGTSPAQPGGFIGARWGPIVWMADAWMP